MKPVELEESKFVLIYVMEVFEISSQWPFKGMNLLLKSDVFFSSVPY